MLKKMGNRLKNQKGLTLIELLAVIVILGIIAAIAIPSIGGIIQSSKEDAAKADAIQVINSAKLYVSANGIPDDNTLSLTDLEEFVDDVNTLNLVTVTVTDAGAYSITADAIDVNIKFRGATITLINNDEGKGTRTIGSAT